MSKAKRNRATREKRQALAAASRDGIDAKLGRAEHHLETIKREVAEFIAPNPDHFVSDYDAARQQIAVKPSQKLFAKRNDWSAVIGDCVHNLRSALDHLAHQLVVLGGGVPKSGRGGTAYPILDSSTGPRGGPRQVRIETTSGSVAPAVQTRIEELQPYKRTNPSVDDLLWILSELDNMDKHRELATTAVAMSDFSFGIVSMRDINVHVDHVGFSGPFDQNTELARLKAIVAGPNPKMEMKHEGTIEITLGVPCIKAGEPLIPTLESLRDDVFGVVADLWALGCDHA